MEDEISIFHLILESRHFTLSMLNAIKFWLCSLLSVGFLHLMAILLTLPAFLTAGQTLFTSVVTVPALALSLLGTRTDPGVMNISTGKNAVALNGDNLRYAAWCYGARFLPSIAFLLLGHLLSIVSIVDAIEDASSCSASQIADVIIASLDGDGEPTTAAAPLPPPSANCSSSVPALQIKSDGVFLLNLTNLCFLHLYLVAVSASFICRGHQLWQRHPGHCPAWIWSSALLTAAVLLYSLSLGLTFCSECFFPVPLSAWLILLLGLPVVMAVNEVIKRQEIKVEVRYQKRERLEFGTKLGINSPF